METPGTVQDDVSAVRDFASQVRALCAQLTANPFNTPAAEKLLTDDAERRAAYQDFTTNLDTIQAVFSQSDDMHVAGYLEAHERVASGDADGPDDAETWVPGDLTGHARADWLEGFRSHFEP